MKRNFSSCVAVLVCLAVALTGCQHTLPKPVNADGSTNVSVAVDEAVFGYGLTMHDLNKYIAPCKANPATLGCNAQLIAQIQSASDKSWKALTAAQAAVKNMPPGAKGIDAALADATAALAFLQSFSVQVPK